MNVLFLTSPVPRHAPMFTDEKRPPLGIGFMISVLRKLGHQVAFSDEYLRPTNIIESGYLEKKRVDLVGIYANTICFEGTLDLLRRIQLRRESGQWHGQIALGGPHTSVGMQSIPGYVDWVVVGEGEHTIVDIVEGRAHDRVISGRAVNDLDTLPFPAWEDFIHLPYPWDTTFASESPVYPMNTSRGCPFSCTFCSVNAVWGRCWRAMSPERVVAEVEFLQRYYGARTVYFREDHFTLDKGRTLAFCELLLKRNISVDWLCESRIDGIDDAALLALARRSGCRLFYLGIESGSQRMLDRFNKKITVEQIEHTCALVKQAGISIYASFIVGVPGETEEDARLTQKLIDKIQPDFVGMNPYVGLPGSALYEEVRRKGQYEYMNEFGVLYVTGHNRRIKKYWGDDTRWLVPGSDPLRTLAKKTGQKLLHTDLATAVRGLRRRAGHLLSR
jgi:O-antigen biosynthesis protein